MTFQTNDKKDNNRDLKNKKDLENEIRPVWQGLKNSTRTLTDKKSELCEFSYDMRSFKS